MTTRSGDPAVTPQRWAASLALQRAETAANPQFAAMAKALEPSKDERERIAAADQAVREAEQAVNAAGLTVAQARKGIPPTYDKARPFTFFERGLSAHKAARAALPTLEIDLAEARDLLQNAIRRRNGLGRVVEQARMERRRAAKLAHTPKLAPVHPRSDSWNTAMRELR